MYRIKKLLIGLSCFISINIFGQEKLIFSLQEAINYALEYNKTLRNADMAVLEAKKKINETIFAGLPQVDATVDYSNFLGAKSELSFGEGAPTTTIRFNPTSNLNLTVGQLIFNGSYIVGIQSAKIYKEISLTNLRKTEQDVKEQVTKSYLLALVSEQTIQIIEQNLENTQDIFSKTEVMVSVGIAEKLDLDQFAVQLSSLENAKKSAERQSEVAFNLLRLQLGLEVNTPIELTDSLSALINLVNNNILSSSSFLLDNNLDYQLINTQEQLAQKQITLRKMNYLPTISGYYRYTEKILKPEFDISPNNVVGLNVNIPIFSSGMRNAQLSQARIQYETSQNTKSLVSDQLLLQERQYRYNVRNAMEQYENRIENVDVAYRIYQNYQLKYEQGVASSLDVATSNSNYLQAETEYINAIINLYDSHLALQKLMNLL